MAPEPERDKPSPFRAAKDKMDNVAGHTRIVRKMAEKAFDSNRAANRSAHRRSLAEQCRADTQFGSALFYRQRKIAAHSH